MLILKYDLIQRVHTEIQGGGGKIIGRLLRTKKNILQDNCFSFFGVMNIGGVKKV